MKNSAYNAFFKMTSVFWALVCPMHGSGPFMQKLECVLGYKKKKPVFDVSLKLWFREAFTVCVDLQYTTPYEIFIRV